jgi:pimeloyl-ACP methyl ester carboxylesterase
MLNRSLLVAGAVLAFSAGADAATETPDTRTTYKVVKVQGLDIFYREAGSKDKPTILLLHGFPTSSQMFRNLIPALADRFHLVAPDYPGFGHSSMPGVREFEYTFDNLATVIDAFTTELKLTKYSLYVQDYGAPVGYRLAVKHPERVQALIVQNGNAYDEGIANAFWDPLRAYWKERTPTNAAPLLKALELDGTRWQYTHGVRRPELINPDTWLLDQTLLDRPGNKDIQLQLFYDYGSNPRHYAEWQAFFRRYQPPTLIVWGKNDEIFPAAGAHPYLRDLPRAKLHLLDTGHFALEEEGVTIARLIREFFASSVSSKTM